MFVINVDLKCDMILQLFFLRANRKHTTTTERRDIKKLGSDVVFICLYASVCVCVCAKGANAVQNLDVVCIVVFTSSLIRDL